MGPAYRWIAAGPVKACFAEAYSQDPSFHTAHRFARGY
jgi:hypothetical protein